ncbi:hypothetical protein FXF00_05645 [Vibrio cholerae]|nr:hypothetical protein FXF00_05645 [Vibrio cholerae]
MICQFSNSDVALLRNSEFTTNRSQNSEQNSSVILPSDKALMGMLPLEESQMKLIILLRNKAQRCNQI